MSLADKQYLKIVEDILLSGYYDQNRTGVSTYKIPHQVMQFDLEKEFPILTTKFVAFKTAVKEMLWIYKDQSNSVLKLQEQNVQIWNEWGILSTSQELVYILPKRRKKLKKLKEIKASTIIDINAEIKESNNFGMYYILEKSRKNQRAKIQFCDTGFVNEVPLSSLSTGELRDVYVRTINSVGYYGQYKSDDILNYFGEHHKKWTSTWVNMIRRCSIPSLINDDLNNELFVHESFQSCESFLRWVMESNRYGKDLLDDLQLDKDYYSSNYYGKDSCTLLTSKEKSDLALEKWYRMNGQVFYSILDIAKYFKDEMHLPKTHKLNGECNASVIEKYISNFEEIKELTVLYPNKRIKKGMLRFSLKPDNTIKKAYGYQVDKFKQIDKLIHALKNNPQDRRMIMSLWNIEDLSEMALQPCCFMTLWDVTDGRLNCMLVQRSGDIPLGIPFNSSQYAVLIHLIAQVTGLRPGLFTHVINNAHIYENQLEGMELHLSRKGQDLPAPTLWINPEVKDFYEFTPDDIKLIDYNHLGKIKMEVSA